MSTPENGFRAPLPEELAPLFPNYQILSLIATGGMGAVYHAIQISLDREIAIKILPVEFGDDPEFCKSFETEAKAMAKLNHPNLISVYDFGEVNGMLFIAMEYVPGQSLYEACNGSAVDPAEVIRLMTGISLGLAHAHGHGILHRDIKPANILLDSHQQPKIGDFGLARHVDVQVQAGETIFGTPGYTAPEVVESPLTVDQRADIFSLGVLMHELLTGRLPASDPRPPSVIARCDPRLDAVVTKATHKIPALRYQSAAEMADALQKIASSSGPKVMRTATPAAPHRPPVKRYAKQPAKKSGSGMQVGLVLITGMVVLFLFRDQIFPKNHPSPNPAPFVSQPPEPVIPTPELTKPNLLEPDPVVSLPELIKPDPDPVVVVTEPEKPHPSPVASETGIAHDGSGSVNHEQPKFDVEGFLTHARSVMVGRCGVNAAKREEALRKNVSDFKTDALKLIKENLPESVHAGAGRELDTLVSELKTNGCRMGKKIMTPLRHKKYIVKLHKDYQTKESQIDTEMMSVFVEPQKTYLYGLGIKLKALREANDSAAADLIQAEIDKVAASPDYFPGLMLAAKKE